MDTATGGTLVLVAVAWSATALIEYRTFRKSSTITGWADTVAVAVIAVLTGPGMLVFRFIGAIETRIERWLDRKRISQREKGMFKNGLG